MMAKGLPVAIQLHIDDGGASLLGGYLRFLGAQDVSALISLLSGKSFWESDIPFATTAFGDIFAWNSDGFIQLYHMVDGTSSIIMAGDEFFFRDIEDSSFQKEHFEMELFGKAREALGEISENQCYAFEPLPILGGSKDLKSLKIESFIPYISLIVSLL